MAASEEYIQSLVDDLGEGLPVEVKNWIDPDTPEGQAKIVRACLAMRNHGGGFLVIGFNNKTYLPEPAPIYDPRVVFDTDAINVLVNRYASERFEVVVHFPTRDGRKFPVLEAAPGVVTPVATRRPLQSNGADGSIRSLVKADTVYVRTMNSNGTPSTTEAGHQDWRALVERCFDNREAGIGRFLRRHLGERGAEVERIFSAQSERQNPALEMLDSGRAKFEELLCIRGKELAYPGSWEVAGCLSPAVLAQHPTQDLLYQLSSANPRYTGWPLWINSFGNPDPDSRPHVVEGGWQASVKPESEFWRIEPGGNFYAFDLLRDDTADFRLSPERPEPGTALEPILVVRDVTHALGVMLAFSRQLGAEEEAVLDVGFRWSGLWGRRLSAWHHPDRWFDDTAAEAMDEQVTTTIRLPVNTAESALPGYVHAATAELFAAFNGQSFARSVVEQISGELLRRR